MPSGLMGFPRSDYQSGRLFFARSMRLRRRLMNSENCIFLMRGSFVII
jgi:hypothetical protein